MKRSVSLVGLLLWVLPVFSQTDIIRNGNFSNGSIYWNLGQYGGSSSGSVNNGEYRIQVNTAGSEHWHVQFTQSGLALTQGKRYTFSFDARKGPQNSDSQSMQVNVGMSNSPYTSYFGNQNNMVTLSTAQTAHSFSFTMNYATDQNARVEFNCGKSTGTFYIDNVRLYEDVTPVSLLTVTPADLNFETLLVGESKQMTVMLQNSGTAATLISAMQSSDPRFSIGLSSPVTVNAGTAVSLPVIFTPTAAGAANGVLSIYSNATDHPTSTINLSGQSTIAGLSYSPSSFTLSSTPDIPALQTFTIVNTGTTPLTWSISSNSTLFSVSPSSGTVAGNSRSECIIQGLSATTGSFTGTLTFQHSASNIASPVLLPVTFTVTTGYQPTSPYILHPELAIDFIRDIATFRSHQRDNDRGGYYTNIDRQGNPTSANEKALCGQSRIAYTFVRAFMVTGDEQYLSMARYALKFLYDHGWNNGWYFITDLAGNYINHWGHNDWWSFQQHYALVGITAMVEATGGNVNWNDEAQSDHTWLMRGINLNYTKLWDSNQSTKGYFDRANTAWTNKWGKGFHATVDGITTHGLLMALMYDSLNHRQRFFELSDNVMDYLISNMSVSAAGFPEVYNSDWSINTSVTSMDIGHGYKTAWVLQRAYLLDPSKERYRNGAQALMQNLWDHGTYDEVNGGPFTYLNWQIGEITGRNKDFWMVEQGYNSGMISYYTATTQEQRDLYLKIADGSINFFMNHQLDPVYGEAYSVVNADGSAIIDGSKGGLFTAGYHSSELGYYAYLYGSLYYHKKPVDLYYFYPAKSNEQNVKLTPLAIEDNLLKIIGVTLDGVPYSDFNTDTRTIHLPANVGGKLKVTFGFTPVPKYTINASTSSGGGISPSGALTVNEGSSLTFNITSAQGYRIDNVIVDGTTVGDGAIYTFTNITSDHTISASFAPVPSYTISATATSGGTTSPSGDVNVYEHSSQTFTFNPASGYRISNVIVDGISLGEITTYTFDDVTTNHSLHVQFQALPLYRITASAGEGGTITPSDTVTVNEGGSVAFTFSPDAGYQIASVTIDGTPASISSNYTFTSVTSDHSISVTFSVIMYTITASAGNGGSISPSGTISVNHGGSQTYTITPANGFQISSVVVDGVSSGTSSSYTFSSVTSSHTINAVFTSIPTILYQINCGGNASSSFTTDQYYSGGTARPVNNAINTSGVTNPAPQNVYKSERYGTSTYTFSNLTTGTAYKIRLHFAELYWTASGKRKFNVLINGTTVLSNFDIFAVAGAQYKAVVRDFTATANSSGKIIINFNTITDNASIEGIEISR